MCTGVPGELPGHLVHLAGAVLAPVPPRGVPEHVTGAAVLPCLQMDTTVPFVVMRSRAPPASVQRHAVLGVVVGLDAELLIEAEHHVLLGQARSSGTKARIVGANP